MKKILIIFVFLFLCFLLVSCDKDVKISNSLSKWTADLIEENLLETDDSAAKLLNPTKLTTTVNFSNDKIVSASYANLGLLVVKDEKNKDGFYSLMHNKYLLEPSLTTGGYTYTVTSDQYVGFYVTVRVNGSIICFDALGNTLYEGNTSYSVSFSKIDENIYANLFDNSLGQVSKRYKYNSDGTIEETNTNNNTLVEGDNPFEAGDKYMDIGSFDSKEMYGIDGYMVSQAGSYVSVFKKSNGKLVSSFLVPSSNYCIAGTNLYYQEVSIIPSDAKEFDFYYAIGDRYYSSTPAKGLLTSYKIDMLNGKTSKVDLDYIIIDYDGYYNNNSGKAKYAIIKAVRINENKGISMQTQGEEYLINEKGQLIARADGISPRNFIKLSNGGFYNVENKILYDKKMNVISYLSSIDPTYIKGIGFVGKYGSKYGIVNEKGIVALPFSYDYIYLDVSNNTVLVQKENEIHKLSLTSYVITSFSTTSEFTRFSAGLYGIKNNDELNLYDLNTHLITLDSNKTSFIGNTDFAFGNYSYFALRDSNSTTFYAFTPKELPNSNNLVPIQIDIENTSNDSPIVELYTITNDTNYPFSISNGTYTSTNTDNPSKSTLTIQALASISLSFNYKVSSESNYDKLIISVNGVEKNTFSGENNGSKTFVLSVGDVLTISYSKDGSTNGGSDCISISNISATQN